MADALNDVYAEKVYYVMLAISKFKIYQLNYAARPSTTRPYAMHSRSSAALYLN